MSLRRGEFALVYFPHSDLRTVKKIHQTTLRDETLTFLQRLTVAVGNTTNTALVFSLQSSKRESLEYTSLLQTVDHLAARKDQLREPVEGKEVLASQQGGLGLNPR